MNLGYVIGAMCAVFAFALVGFLLAEDEGWPTAFAIMIGAVILVAVLAAAIAGLFHLTH